MALLSIVPEFLCWSYFIFAALYKLMGDLLSNCDTNRDTNCDNSDTNCRNIESNPADSVGSELNYCTFKRRGTVRRTRGHGSMDILSQIRSEKRLMRMTWEQNKECLLYRSFYNAMTERYHQTLRQS